MKHPLQEWNIRPLLQSILSKEYSQREVREFVQCCFFLALPLIRKKIALGKLKLNTLGMKEADVVYDCLADIFQRDAGGGFIQIQHYVDLLETPFDSLSDAETIVALRRLVFGAVNKHMTRIYADLDPALGKVLRNLKLALNRSSLFQLVVEFGEQYLVPVNLDPLRNCPPYSFHDLVHSFSRYISIHDNIPTMLSKLYTMFLEQNENRRQVNVVALALFIKETYALGWESDEPQTPEESVNHNFMQIFVETICEQVWREMRATYVTSGKRSDQEYEAYRPALVAIMTRASNEDLNQSYFEILKQVLPDMTERDYASEHRSILEYLAK